MTLDSRYPYLPLGPLKLVFIYVKVSLSQGLTNTVKYYRGMKNKCPSLVGGSNVGRGSVSKFWVTLDPL